jgi:peptidyl-prolyl cis-trans isomerase D
MLEAMRKGAGTWVAKIFIGLLVLSFAVWGIADIFGGYGSQTVATVGGTEIPAEEFQREFRREVRNLSNQAGRDFSLDDARAIGLDRQVLLRIIGDAALQEQAKQLGVDVSDKAVVARIRREPAFKDATGQFSQERFYRVLLANGLSEQGFLERQRRALTQEQITEAVISGAAVPDTMAEAANRFRNETRTLSYISVPLDSLESIGAPTDEQLRGYYNSHKSEFRAPEYRKVGMIVLTPDDVAEKISVPEEEIKTYFERNKAQFGTPERRAVLQINFPDDVGAKEAYEKLKNGAEFMEIAKARGLSEKDVDLGIVSKSAILDETVAKAIFELPVDQVSEPIKGQLATVIAKVTKIEPADEKSLEDVRDRIRKTIAAREVATKVLDVYDKIEDERAAGSTLSEIAKKLDLTYVDIAEVDRRGQDKSGEQIDRLATEPSVLQAIFSADAGVETDPIETTDKGFVWYEVVEVKPERQKEFEEARAEIEKSWRKAQERDLLSKKGQELVDQMKGGKTLAAVAEELSLEVKETADLKRGARAEGVPSAAIQQAFALAEGQYGSASAQDGKSRVVFKIVKVNLPKNLNSKGRDNLVKALRPQIGDDLIAQYVRALRETFGVNINQAALEQATTGRRPGTQ